MRFLLDHMFVVHQMVNMLVNPIFLILSLGGAGMLLRRFAWCRMARLLSVGAGGILLLMSWPPLVDVIGFALESDFPMAKAESYPPADAILVLGGGVGMPPPDAGYPYPMLADGADRIWFGAMLWHAQTKTNAAVKVYCTGLDVSASTIPVLKAFGVPAVSIVALDGPRNTEEEARRCEKVLAGRRVLLVTSALHMRRALRIFRKYAPNLKVIPAPTDHQFLEARDAFRDWRYYFPNTGTLARATAIEHELIGLLRYW